MATDTREVRAEATPVSLAWGVHAVETADGMADGAVLWLAGGACLLLWTAIALLLTS